MWRQNKHEMRKKVEEITKNKGITSQIVTLIEEEDVKAKWGKTDLHRHRGAPTLVGVWSNTLVMDQEVY